MNFYHLWGTFGLATLDLLTPYDFWRQFRKLQGRRFFPRQEIEKLQLKKLQKLYSHSCRTIPYYSKLYHQGKIPDKLRSLNNLDKLPLMTKENVLGDKYPRNLSFTVFSKNEKILRGITSGTTGKPFPCFWNLHKLNDHTANYLNHMEWTGHRYGEPHAVLKHSHIPAGTLGLLSRLYNRIYNHRVFLPCEILSPSILQKYITIMKRKRVHHLKGYVSAISCLSKYVTDHQIDFQLRSIRTGAEMLFPSSRRFFEDALHCEVFENYGSQEFGAIAHECQGHVGLHIADESFIVKIIKDGKAVIGEEGDIVITDLVNHAQSFIRYVIGDRGIISDEFCSCGHKHTILRAIKGRSNDTILSPSGTWVSSSTFHRIIEPLKELIQWQVEQLTIKRLIFRLVVLRENPSHEPSITASLTELDPAFEVSFEYVDQIPKKRGEKHKCVLSPFIPRRD